MRRTAVLNLRNFENVFLVIKRNGILLFLSFSFLIGLFSGVISFENTIFLEDLFLEYFFKCNITEFSFIRNLFDSFLKNLLVIGIAFVCGSSILGVVLAPVYVSFFGYFCGTYSSMIYSDYALKGIAFYAVIILPCVVLVTVALLISSTESFKFSLFLIKLIFSTSPPVNFSLLFKKFCIKYLMICLLVFLAAIVSSFLCLNLGNKFLLL